MERFQRYNRQLQLRGFGPEAQQKLQDAKVLVIGAGGLGVPALQYLAGMGIGTLGIMDGDSISFSNLHRQVLYTENEVGKLKVEVAATKLLLLNSDISIKAYPEFISPENALEIIKDYDVVIDATDSFAARYLINDACVILKKPFVYGALHRYEGQVSVFNFEGGPTYRCVYPTPPSANEIPDCNSGGILGVVPGLVGCQQALEAVKIITGVGKNLSGSLMLFDFLNNEQFKVKLKAKPENKQVTALQKTYELASCETVTLEVQELFDWYIAGKDFYLLDVREQAEFAQGHLKNAHLIPLAELEKQAKNLPEHLPVITFCQKGSRSLKAAEFLRKNATVSEVYSLNGGMDAWQKQLGSKLVEG